MLPADSLARRNRVENRVPQVRLFAPFKTSTGAAWEDAARAAPQKSVRPEKRLQSRIAPAANRLTCFNFTSKTRLLVAACLGWAAAATVFLAFRGRGPFSDEGSSCAIAQAVLQGSLPYRDYFNEKVPLQYFWTALVMRATVNGVEGARIASSIALGFALTLSLSGLFRRAASILLVAAWGVVIVLAAVLMRAFNNTADSTLALLFAACALVIFDGQRIRPSVQSVLVGVIQGLACGFRQTVLVSAVVLLLAPWHRTTRWAYASGFLLGAGLWIAPLYGIGILHETLAATLLFHSDNVDWISYFRWITQNDYPPFLIWLLCLGSVAAIGFRLREARWALIWLLAAAAPFFGRMDAFRLWPSTLAAFTYIFIRFGDGAKYISLVLFGLLTIVAILSAPGFRSFQRENEVARRIKRYSTDQQTIWVGPFNPNAYCLSNRQSASRYYFVLPWIAKAGIRAQIVKDISEKKPNLIVDVSDKEFSLSQLLPGLMPLLQEKYALVEDSGDAKYYLLRAGTKAETATDRPTAARP